MAQDKLKPKVKLPANTKNRKVGKKHGKAVTQRSNRPIQPKKKGVAEARKLKQVISKTVNTTMEAEIRAKASNETKNLSKAQQAVVEYHKKATSVSS